MTEELTIAQERGLKETQKAWTRNLSAVLISTNIILGTPFLLEHTDAETLLVLGNDLNELLHAIKSELEKKGMPEVDEERVTAIIETNNQIRLNAAEKFDKDFSDPENAAPERLGMYV